MDNFICVQVRESVDNLTSERLDNVFFKPAMLPKATADRTTRHVFKEAISDTLLDRVITIHNGNCLHAEEFLGLFGTKVLNDIGMAQLL